MASSRKLRLKLMIDKINKKVVYAKSNKDFVDILFSFLTMPIGKIIHLFGGKSAIGSMDMLCESLKNLGQEYFNTKSCKSMILNPLSSSRSHYSVLILRVDLDNPRRLYQCKKGKLFPFYSSSPNAKCGCGEIMNRTTTFVLEDWKGGADGDGIFVEGNSTYLIFDDLDVMSTSFAAIQSILDKFNFKDLDDIEESHVDLSESLVYSYVQFYL